MPKRRRNKRHEDDWSTNIPPAKRRRSFGQRKVFTAPYVSDNDPAQPLPGTSRDHLHDYGHTDVKPLHSPGESLFSEEDGEIGVENVDTEQSLLEDGEICDDIDLEVHDSDLEVHDLDLEVHDLRTKLRPKLSDLRHQLHSYSHPESDDQNGISVQEDDQNDGVCDNSNQNTSIDLRSRLSGRKRPEQTRTAQPDPHSLTITVHADRTGTASSHRKSESQDRHSWRQLTHVTTHSKVHDREVLMYEDDDIFGTPTEEEGTTCVTADHHGRRRITKSLGVKSDPQPNSFRELGQELKDRHRARQTHTRADRSPSFEPSYKKSDRTRHVHEAERLRNAREPAGRRHSQQTWHHHSQEGEQCDRRGVKRVHDSAQSPHTDRLERNSRNRDRNRDFHRQIRHRDGPDRERDGPNRDRDGPNRDRDGPDRDRDGPNRDRDGPDRERDGPNRERDGPNRERDGPDREKGGPDRERDGPNRERDGPDREKGGPDGERDGPNRERDGPDRDRDDPGRERGGPGRERGGPNRDRDGPDRERGGPDRERGGPNRERDGPDREKGGPDRERGRPNRDRDGPDRERGGPNRDRDGPDREKSGPNRERDGPDREKGGPDRERDGPNRERDGPDREKGGPDRDRDGPNRERDGPDRERDGPDRERGGPNRDRDGPGRERGGPNRERDGPDRERGGPNRERDGPGRERGGPNRERDGPNRERDGPDRERGGPNRDRDGPDRERGGPNRDRDGPDRDTHGSVDQSHDRDGSKHQSRDQDGWNRQNRGRNGSHCQNQDADDPRPGTSRETCTKTTEHRESDGRELGSHRIRDGSEQRHGRQRHGEQPVNYDRFIQDVGCTPPDASADSICTFLAQHLHHVTRFVKQPTGQQGETRNRLLALLRVALLESSPLASNNRDQILSGLQKIKIFFIPLSKDLQKGLLPTKDRVPDEDDYIPMRHLLDILKAVLNTDGSDNGSDRRSRSRDGSDHQSYNRDRSDHQSYNRDGLEHRSRKRDGSQHQTKNRNGWDDQSHNRDGSHDRSYKRDGSHHPSHNTDGSSHQSREQDGSNRQSRGRINSHRRSQDIDDPRPETSRETCTRTTELREREGREYGTRHRIRDGSEQRHGRQSHGQQPVNYDRFIQDVGCAPPDASADSICIFLAQHLDHVTRFVKQPTGKQGETRNRLLALLRVALLESSPLTSNNRNQILSGLKEIQFFDSPLVKDLQKGLLPTKNKVPDEDDLKPMRHVLDIMKVMVKHRLLPHGDVLLFLTSLRGVLQNVSIIVRGEDARQPLYDSIDVIQRHIQDLEQRENRDVEMLECGNDDLDLPILPDISDIRRNQRADISPRNVLDHFQSASEYIRYIFLTFREDFIRPLCDAIREYITYTESQRERQGRGGGQRWGQRFRNQNVRLYENVQVVDTALSRDTGVDVMIKIDSSRIRNFNSRLVFGSLVCLSSDDFRSVIYATVKDRDTQTLKNDGHVNVNLLNWDEIAAAERRRNERRGGPNVNIQATDRDGERERGGGIVFHNQAPGYNPRPPQRQAGVGGPTSDLDVLRGRNFVMLESTAFYTAYVHSLESLRAMHWRVASSESSLPFKKQLLELSRVLSPPRYLQASDGLISFACMKKYAPRLTREETFSYSPSSPIATPSERYKNIHVEKLDEWPTSAELGVDESQYSALRQALTKEVVLIQGPPGTGKTTLGIRLAELLLKNEHLWREDEHNILEKTPLLLISYTNHALDQFLSELVKLPVLQGCAQHDVVRVGSRCENEKLAQHVLNKLRKTADPGGGQPVDQIRLHKLRKGRLQIDEKIRGFTEGILHENTLREKRVITDEHFQGLQRGKMVSIIPGIIRWLQLHTDDFGHMNQSGMNSESKLNSSERRLAHSDVMIQHNDQLLPEGNKNVTSQNLAEETGPRDDADDDDMGEADLEDNILQRRVLDLDDDDDDQSCDSESEESSSYSTSNTPVMAANVDDLQSGYFFWENQFWMKFPESFKRKVAEKIKKEVYSRDVMSPGDEKTILDIWNLDIKQRWRLYRLWLSRVTADLYRRRRADEAEFQGVSARVVEQRNCLDLRIMKRARVVAMTTTGASRMTSVLRALGPRVIMVEEAAQVSEAHVLSSLSPACFHLIMIGDHLQLRPAYNNFDLTARHHRHHIDISLFERLCRGGVPYRTLSLQHRMRPEISSLLVPTIYTQLHDHPSVKNYPHVKGVMHDVFFLNHQHPEDTPEDSKSKQNTHEAEFLAGLYRYLRLQGYGAKDITILALYKEQVMLLRKLIKVVETRDPLIPSPPRDLEEELMDFPARGRLPGCPQTHGARVTAVDNFQGEESKVVLLSLVRSNTEGRIGFLREPNRVCVALSRAKEGLFVIGNCSMLAEKSPECWKPILDAAKGREILGPALPLRCPRHPDHVTNVARKDDFLRLCPNGGCAASCDVRRECGHACDQKCHNPELFHHDDCLKPCARKCSYGHPCSGHFCAYPCPPCEEKVEMTMERCGHTVLVECGSQLCPPPCPQRCEKTLECGHRCGAKCGVPCTDCKELIKVTSACGHEFQVACFKKDTAECTVPCTAVLQCGHPCTGKCGTCFAGRLHVPCNKKCERTLVCGHVCHGMCTKTCPPCNKPCQGKCAHSKCSEKCGDTCTPCVELCSWKCKPRCKNRFLWCTKRCSELCDRERCDTPCNRKLQCRKCERHYRCRGLLCEAVCPEACPVCNADIFEIFFGTEDEEDARFYKMADCRCVLEVSALDQYMDQVTEGNEIVGKRCPKCKTPMITSLRYGNVLKKTNADMARVKEKVLSPPDDVKIRQRELLKRLWNENPSKDVEFNFENAIDSAKTLEDLSVRENQLNFLKAIRELRSKTGLLSSQSAVAKACRLLDRLRDWTMVKYRSSFNEQQCEEFKRELQRTQLTILFLGIVSNMDNRKEECQDTYPHAEKCLRRLEDKPEVLTPEEETDMRTRVESLRGRWLSGVGVSDAERLMVVKAMGFKQGHWYKCPNGHIYAIGECGGAMQRSVCPECRSDIGGSQHRLTDGNAVATEMDGATYGAWSEQANLANYENLDL